MPMRTLVTLLALLVATAAVTAAEAANPVGKATESGLSVMAIIVTDPDWREKWNTSPDTVPAFHTPGVLKVGDEVTLITMFSGATEKSGFARIRCDAVITTPDGKVETHPAQVCFEGPVSGPADSIFLTGQEIRFVVTPEDLPGIHEFEIGVIDGHRGVRASVKVSLEIAGKDAT